MTINRLLVFETWQMLAHPGFRMGHRRAGLGGWQYVCTYGSNTIRKPYVYGRMRAQPIQLDLPHAWVILAPVQAHGTSKSMGHTQTHIEVPSVDGMSFISVRPVRVKRSICTAYGNVILYYGTSHTSLCHARPLVWPTIFDAYAHTPDHRGRYRYTRMLVWLKLGRSVYVSYSRFSMGGGFVQSPNLIHGLSDRPMAVRLVAALKKFAKLAHDFQLKEMYEASWTSVDQEEDPRGSKGPAGCRPSQARRDKRVVKRKDQSIEGWGGGRAVERSRVSRQLRE